MAPDPKDIFTTTCQHLWQKYRRRLSAALCLTVLLIIVVSV